MSRQLPCGEARTLTQGAGLVGIDHHFLPAGPGQVDGPEGGADAAGGQGSGIAVGQNSTAGREQGLGMFRQAQAGLGVLAMELQCGCEKGLVPGGGCPAMRGQLLGERPLMTHADRQVHRRGAGGLQGHCVPLQAGEPILGTFHGIQAEEHAVSGGATYGRGPSDHQVLEGLDQGGDAADGTVGLDLGKAGLVEQDQDAVLPGQGLET